jgi:methyl coenzyme M reductase system subunit A2
MIVVSHHLDFVREISHRALLMLDGRLVKEGSPEEVVRSFMEMPGAEFLSELGPRADE